MQKLRFAREPAGLDLGIVEDAVDGLDQTLA